MTAAYVHYTGKDQDGFIREDWRTVVEVDVFVESLYKQGYGQLEVRDEYGVNVGWIRRVPGGRRERWGKGAEVTP